MDGVAIRASFQGRLWYRKKLHPVEILVSLFYVVESTDAPLTVTAAEINKFNVGRLPEIQAVWRRQVPVSWPVHVTPKWRLVH
jgi:hypothetical protein